MSDLTTWVARLTERRKQGIAQSTRAARRGDLIISNWTSYVDVLYLAFRSVLPVSIALVLNLV